MMPRTDVRFFRESDGTVPIVDWLELLPRKAEMKCRVKLERLRELGYEIRRPEADYLRDGIYELRATFGGIHHRLLYCYMGPAAVVVTHGIVKERRVPPREIDLAILRKDLVRRDPARHTAEYL